MAKYLTEFLGTFFLVLTIGLALANAGNVAPLAIGSILMVLVYMGGHISGAHYNPAVSLALLLRGKMRAAEFIPYVIVQVVAGIAGAWVAYGISGVTFAPLLGTGIGYWKGLLVEALYTFALALVVLNVATSPRTAGNSYYGLAIGFTVAAGAFTVGSVSGAAFNPAVAIGPTILHAAISGGTYQNLWIYLVGPFAGGALAALAFRLQHTSSELD